MKSFDRQSLEAQTRLVSRYVAGDLSRSERADFEAWLVASPELAAEVEMERRLRRGMASAARRGWLNGSPDSMRRSTRSQLAVAASVVGAFALGILLLRPAPHEAAAVDAHATVSADVTPARTVRLGSVRGLGSSPDVMFLRAAPPAELVIQPDVVMLTCDDGSIALECADGAPPSTPLYPEYELDIVNRDGAMLAWRSARQLAPLDAPLSFALREPGSLEIGDYDLIVRGHSADHEEIVARFWLRVAAE